MDLKNTFSVHKLSEEKNSDLCFGKLSENCCGCGACANVCPVNAISMVQNDEGFLYPVIDESLCTNCGLCSKTCNFNSKRNSVIDSFAALADDEIRNVSSSGGVFYNLAQKILLDGGYVCGAAFSDDFKSVNHILISSIEDLPKLQSSKYLQSDTKNVYKEIKDLLNNDKKVLFSGTPCQVDALNKFLKKDYENLITVDILCHGTPSPLVWKKYVEEISKGKKIIETTFRHKKYGWAPSLLLLLFEDNEVFEEPSTENLYYKAFLSNLCLRKSCESCKFTNLNRPSDITVGDFWRIDKFDKKMNDKKGTSCILINTLKGQNFFDEIKTSLKKYKEAPLEKIVKGNPILTEPSKPHDNRKRFFNNLNKTNILENIKYNLDVHYDGVIANFWYSPKNYGAILTAYAIQQYFLMNNKKYFLVNYNRDKKQKELSSFTKDFAQKYLFLTQKFENVEELSILNSQTDNFVVGSDQVFRYPFASAALDLYFLKFTDFSKRRVAFSASFGISDFEADAKNTYEVKKALKRFDNISVRESSGVDLCKNVFDIEAEHILDPVFLVDKQKFDVLVDENLSKYNNKIVCYVLDRNVEIQNQIDLLSKKLNLDVEDIYNKELSVEEWLTAIKTCKYFVTDSFHGCCFAMIFHKQFICLKNKARGTDRFDSLEKTFNFKRNFISSIEKIGNTQIITSEIDWNSIDKTISLEREKAKNWFDKTFNSEKLITQEKITAELDFMTQNFSENSLPKKGNFLDKVFSIKKSDDGKHKKITILGIKLKIRRRK